MFLCVCWCGIKHGQWAQAICSHVIFTSDVDEGGCKLCIEEDVSALLSKVSMHGVVMREVLMIRVYADLTAADDLSEVFARFCRR